MRTTEKCCIRGCDRKAVVKKHKLCKAHLNRFYRTGEPGSEKIINRKTHLPYRMEHDK